MSSISLLLASFIVISQISWAPAQWWHHHHHEHRDRNEDKIHLLPGLEFSPSFDQYAGYLNATAHGRKHFHFYWFVESQSDPEKDPLVLWLNGGPGCSSLTGFFEELGPFKPHKDGKTLFENVYAWNKVANVFFMESPAGVGFSYAEDGNVTTDDDTVADHNFRAVLDFFDKYPQFKGRDFYITGESYGGIYVPTLSQRVIEAQNAGKFPGKFVGLAIGNGMLSAEAQQNSLIHLQYYRGVIGYEDWDDINEKCCGSANTTCDYTESLLPGPDGLGYVSDGSACGNKSIYIAEKLVETTQNDAYNQYQDCYNPTGGRTDRLLQTMRTSFPKYPWASRETMLKKDPWWASQTALFRRHHSWNHHGHHRSGGSNNGFNYDSTDALSGFPCFMDNATMSYVNSFFTKVAIHVRRDHQPKTWTTCNNAFETGSYVRTYMEMDNVFQYILNSSDVRILIYNGDVDSVCNFLGDEWFIRRVAEDNDLAVVEKRDKWVYRGRIGGYIKKFDRIDLLTIKGAGHFVPTDRAGPALQMIANFLKNSSYSDPVEQSAPEDDYDWLRRYEYALKPQVFIATGQQPMVAAAAMNNAPAQASNNAVITGALVGIGLVGMIVVVLIGMLVGKRYKKTRVGYTKL